MDKNQIRKDAKYVADNIKTIYQYHSVAGGKALLENLTIQLKNPSVFNDPYDCDLDLISFDSASDFNLEEAVKIYNQKRKPLEPKSAIDFGEFTEEEITDAFKNKVFPLYAKTIGVSCFSEIFDNMLMWSHYTYAHKGICIGFNFMKLYMNLSNNSPGQMTMIKVYYTDDYSQLDYFKNKYTSIYHWIRTKAKSWEYEKEIRFLYTNILFKNDDYKEYVKFDKSVIKEIFLGSKMDLNEQNEIIDFCKSNLPHVQVYKMEKEPKSFRLNYKKV